MDECHGGPHEIRPVFRSGLLKALEGGVPAENIHFGVKVADVESTEDGKYLPACCITFCKHCLQWEAVPVLAQHIDTTRSVLPAKTRQAMLALCVRLGVAGASVMLEDGRKLRARAVIGADGVRSVVGRALNIPPPTYAGYIAYRCSTP